MGKILYDVVDLDFEIDCILDLTFTRRLVGGSFYCLRHSDRIPHS